MESSPPQPPCRAAAARRSRLHRGYGQDRQRRPWNQLLRVVPVSFGDQPKPRVTTAATPARGLPRRPVHPRARRRPSPGGRDAPARLQPDQPAAPRRSAPAHVRAAGGVRRPHRSHRHHPPNGVLTMPKTPDRPEIVTIAGARWTRSPDDAAVLEAVDSAGPVLLTESTLRQVVRDQEVEAERLKIRRARFEREHAAFLAAPRVTYRGVTWVR